MRVGRIAVVAVALLTMAASAAAQAKTDVVTLQNGDRITGEIKSLSRGRLKLETDDAGTIDIEWDNVLEVSAIRQFDVMTVDGRLLLGSLGRVAPRTVIIGAGPSAVTLPMAQITNLTPIGASFWAKLEGTVSAGFSYTQSSGITQTTFNSETEYRRPASTVRLTGSATITTQEDHEDDDRASAGLSYSRYRGNKWFVSGAGRFENNQSLGLVLRSQVGGLIGQRLLRSNRGEFQVGGGIVANNEQSVDSGTTQNVEAIVAAQASYYTYDGRKTMLDISANYYPSLSQAGRHRLQLDSSLNRDLVKDLVVSLSFYVTFDSDPPQEGAARTDVGIVTSIGWSFGG